MPMRKITVGYYGNLIDRVEYNTNRIFPKKVGRYLNSRYEGRLPEVIT